jgi:hypothetical protein
LGSLGGDNVLKRRHCGGDASEPRSCDHEDLVKRVTVIQRSGDKAEVVEVY